MGGVDFSHVFRTCLTCGALKRLSFSPDGSFLVAAGLHVVGEAQGDTSHNVDLPPGPQDGGFLGTQPRLQEIAFLSSGIPKFKPGKMPLESWGLGGRSKSKCLSFR